MKCTVETYMLLIILSSYLPNYHLLLLLHITINLEVPLIPKHKLFARQKYFCFWIVQKLHIPDLGCYRRTRLQLGIDFGQNHFPKQLWRD